MQYIALKNVTLNSHNYVAADIIPGTDVPDDRLSFLVRKGLIAPDSDTMAATKPPAGDNDTSIATTSWATERATVGNLLTANQASVETDTTGFFITGSNGVFTRTTSEAAHGSASIALTTSSASANLQFNAPAGVVIPGQVYTITYAVKGTPGDTLTNSGFDWKNSSDATISSVLSGIVTISATWQTISVTGVAPAGATNIKFFAFNNTWAGKTAYFDKFGFWAGAGGDWAMPGTPITNLGIKVSHPNTDDVLVQRWDSSKAVPGWQTIKYCSGERNVASVCMVNGWTATMFFIMRENNFISYRGVVNHPTAPVAQFADFNLLPNGFKNTNYSIVNYRNASTGAITSGRLGRTESALPAAGQSITFELTVQLDGDSSGYGSIPTSLPGTLVTAAPA